MIVKAGGKDRELRYSYKAIKESAVFLEQNPNLKDEDSQNIEKQIFLCFKYGALSKDKTAELDFKESDIEDWLDEDPTLLMVIVTFIGDSVMKITEAGKKTKGKK